MWKTINNLTNKNSKSTNISEINVDGQVINEPREIEDTFNTFFSHIGSQLAETLQECSCLKFEIQTVTTAEVLKSTLKATKATGHDGISPRLLIDSADVIAHNLTIIFNQSILTAIFPDELKVAIIAPIFKSGIKIETTNYRPISLLSAVAKLFEGLISKQLVEYLEANGILAPEQAGLRKNYSTQISLLATTNKLLTNMNKGYLN